MTTAEIYEQISEKSRELARLYRQVQVLGDSPNPVQKAVHKAAAVWHSTPSAIMSKLRTDHVCLARWTAWAILYEFECWDHDEIARAFKHHRTGVLHGLRALRARAAQSHDIREKLKQCGINYE